jgi:hypothetical protein
MACAAQVQVRGALLVGLLQRTRPSNCPKCQGVGAQSKAAGVGGPLNLMRRLLALSLGRSHSKLFTRDSTAYSALQALHRPRLFDTGRFQLLAAIGSSGWRVEGEGPWRTRAGGLSERQDVKGSSM